MIRVEKAKEPESFERKVRQPGYRAMAEMVGKTPVPPRTDGRPCERLTRKVEQPDGTKTEVPLVHESEIPSKELPSYWTEALDELKREYRSICAYSCFKIHPVSGAGSVDHMAPKSTHWDRVYEWDNYRLACSRLNARKNDYPDVLDPFEVGDDWFELELVGFQVIPSPGLADPLKRRVQDTIDRLKLNSFGKDRAKDAENYWSHRPPLYDGVSLRVLRENSPFVARELRRQGRLNPGDTWEAAEPRAH